MEVMKTIQLRRYTLVEGEYDAFVAWWTEWMPKVGITGSRSFVRKSIVSPAGAHPLAFKPCSLPVFAS